MNEFNKLIIEALKGPGVVARNRAAAAELRLLYSQHALESGHSTWRSARVDTLEGLLTKLFSECADERGVAIRLLGHFEEWLLWRQTTAEMLSAQVDDSLLPIDTDKLANDLWRTACLVSDWGLLPSNWAGDSRESRWVQLAMHAVEEKAAELGALPRHRLVPWLSSHASSSGVEQPPYFAGHELPLGVRAVLRQIYGSELPTLCAPATASPVRPQVCIAEDLEQEWRLAAHWARERLLLDPAATLLVIIPNLARVSDRIKRIFLEVLQPGGVWQGTAPPALELALPLYLSQSPWILSALETLKVLLSSRLTGDVLAHWWCDAFWDEDSATWRAMLAQSYRRRPLLELTADRWRSEMRQFLSRFPNAAGTVCVQQVVATDGLRRSLDDAPRSPDDWAENFSRLLQVIGWPGTLTDNDPPEKRQALAGWQKLLEAFAELGPMLGRCSRADALSLLSSLASRMTLERPTGYSSLRITSEFGVVRAYDGIWVTGLRAEVWPAPAETQAFVSRSALVAVGLRSAEVAGQVEQAKEQLRTWQQATTDLQLSWAVSEEESLFLPSPLLSPWLPPIKESVDAAQSWLAEARAPLPSLADRLAEQAPAMEQYRDGQGSVWPMPLSLPGGAWALVEQDRCPFVAYARRRLRSGEYRDPALGIDASLRGQLLHRGFELLWSELGSRDHLLALSQAAAEATIDQVLAKIDFSLLESQIGRALSVRLRERELLRLAKIMREALQLERDRPQNFRVLWKEKKLELTLGTAHLSLRIDRVDELSDGGWVVIDYKSGHSAAPKWDGEEFDAIQMWLYAEAARTRLEGTLTGLAQLKLRSERIGFQALTRHEAVFPKATVDPDLDRLQHEARQRLERLAEDFLRGRAEVNPRRGACEHCDLPILCRKAELLSNPFDTEHLPPNNGDDERS